MKTALRTLAVLGVFAAVLAVLLSVRAGYDRRDIEAAGRLVAAQEGVPAGSACEGRLLSRYARRVLWRCEQAGTPAAEGIVEWEVDVPARSVRLRHPVGQKFSEF